MNRHWIPSCGAHNRRRPILLVTLLLVIGFAASAGASLDAARNLAAKGDPSGALELVEQRLVADPDLPEALFLKGVLLVELRRAEEARGVFERLIELEPGLPEPYNNLAVIQAAAGDYESAVETLRAALRTHASYRTAYENLTKIYTQLASEAYREALEPEPVERPDVVELVLLGQLGQFVGADRPKPEAQLATAEPTAMAQTAGMSEPPRSEEPARAAPAEEAPPGDVEAGETPAPEAAGEEPLLDPSTVARFVESWRSAWQEQRADDYLASYSDSFTPPDGMSRELWRAQRRQRITAPEFIRVTLAYLDEPQVDGATASIRFLQSYESNTFQDRVTKTLVLTWEDGGWKILEERSD